MRLKKALALLICIVLTFSCAAPAFAADGQCDCGNPPIVYVVGRADIYVDPTAEDPQLAVELDMDKILEAAKPVMPSFAKGVFTGDWDEYCDELVEAVRPFFAEYQLDNEGNVKNSSGILYTWSEDEIEDYHWRDNVHDYTFFYDPRLDPWEIADDLNRYIETIEKVTGHDEVCLLSRCMGTSIALAYLTKYASQNNYEDIHNFVMYNGTMNGFALMDEVFTGRVAFDADGIDRYFSDRLGIDVVSEFIKATITLFNKTYALDGLTSVVEKGYYNIYEKVVPRILIETYGGIPGYWTMVSDDAYEEAKKMVFKNTADEYPMLIEKLDRYHNTVQKNIPQTLQAMKTAGVSINVICKYGFQLAPIVKSHDVQSDNTVDLWSQSFGATSAKIGEKLSAEYIKQAEAEGKGAYISPDDEVDASTGLFPEYTWYIKDLPHFSFPFGTDDFLIDICRYDGQMTVDSDERYPRYMRYYEETDSIAPMDDENDQDRYEDKNVITALIDFIRALFQLIISKLGIVK
ncbi:MAG: hypothetical protein ACI4GB_01350 [Acutalibacteraceae bacterium]